MDFGDQIVKRTESKMTGSSSKIIAEDLSFLPTELDPGSPKTPQLYDLLRHAIISLDLEPGTTIQEKNICERLGVSRTPLREAIQLLNKEHLVTVVPNSGTRVSKIDLNDVYDGQFIREALELKSAKVVAEKQSQDLGRELDFNLFKQKRYAEEKNYNEFYLLDEEFHSLICSYGSSKKVWHVVHEAKGQLDRVRRLSFPDENHLDIVFEEHTAIFEAIKSGDVLKAEQAMSAHLSRVYEKIEQLTTQHSKYFS